MFLSVFFLHVWKEKLDFSRTCVNGCYLWELEMSLCHNKYYETHSEQAVFPWCFLCILPQFEQVLSDEIKMSSQQPNTEHKEQNPMLSESSKRGRN